ncbi:MAG TPA: hypothetical protein VJA46_03390 [Acidimicrobiia bacterium]|nr:hypothetical protein [Acidimicrobiia bacterium]
MARTDADRLLELEESAQGVDLYRAPGSELQFQLAAEEADDQPGNVEQHPSAVLARARARRHGLRGAMIDSEKAVARPSGRQGWLGEVEACLAELRQALDEHIEEVEGPDGLLAEIMESTPRLASEVEILRQEHRQLVTALIRAQEISRAVEIDPAHDPLRLRRAVTRLLGRLTLHRQRGSDLVFEAFNVDIGVAG